MFLRPDGTPFALAVRSGSSMGRGWPSERNRAACRCTPREQQARTSNSSSKLELESAYGSAPRLEAAPIAQPVNRSHWIAVA